MIKKLYRFIINIYFEKHDKYVKLYYKIKTGELIYMNDELEKLQLEINKLKRDQRLNKMKYETEIDNIQRKQDLLNLLSPRTDMKDFIQVLFAYIIRVIPFNRAYIKIVKNNYSYSLMVKGKNGKTVEESNYSLQTSIEGLIKNILLNMRGFLINNLREYDSMLFSEDKSALIIPIFISENSSAVCYFENDKEGSYSDKEFNLMNDMLQATGLMILTAIDSTLLSRYQFKILLNPVTDLYTNYYLKTVLEKQIIISKLTKIPFSLIAVKIDSENIDELLIQTAKLFENLTRKVDTIFQLNRNTLAVLLNNSNCEVLEIVMNRLQSNLDAGNYNKITFGNYCFDEDDKVTNSSIINQITVQLEEKNPD